MVFTDLANYTAKVSRSDRQGLHQILRDHEALVAPIVAKHGGRVVKNLGDSFMCLFDAATDALRAALDIQDSLQDRNGLSIRLSMTTGDVEEIEGDAFGESVNLSARINSKTPAGEIWFGLGTRVCMNAAEIPWETVGRFRLKGIPDEIEIFRAVPQHRCWLPESVANAVKMGTLIRYCRGARPPLLPPEPVILLEGFLPGSPALMEAIDSLPVLDPTSLWLSTYNVAGEDRNQWIDSGRGLVIGTPAALETAVQDALKVVVRTSGSDTIVLDVGLHADLEMVMCGLALPTVPLSDVISSYFYDLLPDGQWVNGSVRALLRVEVTSSGASIKALSPGIRLNGRALGSGDAVPLEHASKLHTPIGDLEFLTMNSGYTGVLLADTEMRLGVVSGQTAEIGREPNHPGLPFPDRRGQDNIRWCPGPRAARARAGGFTLDRALAGRRQAALQLVDDSIQLTPLHPRCPTYVISASRDGLTRVEQPVELSIGDFVVAGTTVVAVRRPQ